MKTIFVIRGFVMNKTAAGVDFAELRTIFTDKGYRVVPVDIEWNHRTISSFVDEFIKLYEKQKGEYNIVIGGSFGAMAAFVSAPQIVPDELILCSLSSYFKEDLATRDEERSIRKFGHRRVDDFKTLSAAKIANEIDTTKTKITLLYGEKEVRINVRLVARVKDTASKLKNSKLIEVPGAGHRMREPDYLAGIERLLDSRDTETVPKASLVY